MSRTVTTYYDEAGILEEINFKQKHFTSSKEIGTDFTYKPKILWKFVALAIVLHALVLWGLARLLTGSVGLKTFLWTFTLIILAIQGVTVGAHRYYTHRTFQACTLLRVFFILGQTLAGTLTMFQWCLVHRLHHRYSDTDGDPHNSNRGFFFSHMGWLLVEINPVAKKLSRNIDMSDIKADWMVRFQKKYYLTMFFVFAFFVPMWVPVYFFGESLLNSFLVSFMVRWAALIHLIGTVNSFAHFYGTKPYDKKIHPVETWIISALTLGEGWHNYHHAFPWDYKASEMFDFNLSARTIQLYEKLGLAWDLKTVSPEQIQNRILRSGDGTHPSSSTDEARTHIASKDPQI